MPTGDGQPSPTHAIVVTIMPAEMFYWEQCTEGWAADTAADFGYEWLDWPRRAYGTTDDGATVEIVAQHVRTARHPSVHIVYAWPVGMPQSSLTTWQAPTHDRAVYRMLQELPMRPMPTPRWGR